MAESEGGTSQDFSREHLEQLSDHLETDDKDVIVIPEVKGLGKRHNVGSTAVNKKYKGAAVCKSKYQSGWQRKWPCIAPLKLFSLHCLF